jgi:hypothetical protein
MPTLAEILERLSFISIPTAALGVLVTAEILLVIQDWRLSLLALAAQYVFVGLLLTQVLVPELAALKALIGLIICPVLYVTAVRVRWGRPSAAANGPPAWRLSTSEPFRLVAALMGALVAYNLATRPGLMLPQVEDPAINLACYGLMSLGLLALGLTEEPLKAGMGLLTFLSGFELFYAGLEQSLLVIGFLGLVNLLIALGVAYLASVRAAPHVNGAAEP